MLLGSGVEPTHRNGPCALLPTTPNPLPETHQETGGRCRLAVDPGIRLGSGILCMKAAGVGLGC